MISGPTVFHTTGDLTLLLQQFRRSSISLPLIEQRISSNSLVTVLSCHNDVWNTETGPDADDLVCTLIRYYQFEHIVGGADFSGVFQSLSGVLQRITYAPFHLRLYLQRTLATIE